MKKTIYLFLLLTILPSCTVMYRGVRYYMADLDDYKIFPKTDIHTGSNTFHYAKGDEDILAKMIVEKMDNVELTLDEFLKKTPTTVFMVIRNDSIIFEKYYKGYSREQKSMFFSVSKSVTSLLVGLAVEDGLIGSVHDPVTKYLPELLDGDPYFKSLTLEHLLNMRSGIKFKESYSNPFSGMARLYYGRNQLGQIKRLEFAHKPNTHHYYSSMDTAILGVIVERVTGKKLGEYLEERVWKPCGMQYEATWSLDDKKHQSSKSYCGLSGTAIDLAKIGRLYMNNGNWEGMQILSKDWVDRATTPYIDNDTYQYQWSSTAFGGNLDGKYYLKDSLSCEKLKKEKYGKYEYYKIWHNTDEPAPNQWMLLIYPGNYFALGIMMQVLYVNPEKNIVMVRLGDDWDGRNYWALMDRISRKL